MTAYLLRDLPEIRNRIQQGELTAIDIQGNGTDINPYFFLSFLGFFNFFC